MEHKLNVPQVRVLVALLPDDGSNEPPLGTMPRALLAESAGFVPTSGTMSKVLNGIQNPNSSTGKKHDGLLQFKYIEKVMVDLDGIAVDSYRITREGIAAARSWLSQNTLPEKRDETLSTNKRYAAE